MSNVTPVAKASFKHNNQNFVAIEVSSGDIEIYWVDPSDGIEMFRGYINTPTIPGALRHAATEALYNNPFAIEWVIPTQLSLL